MTWNKKRAAALLLAAAALLGMPAALAQEATYVFPYEGFRYTQKDGETVLTQTNLDEHTELIAALGTTREAILASYMASGIVMEVIPEDGGQIAVSVTDAGEFADVMRMEKITDEQLAAFEQQFAGSGLYESCGLTQTNPVCVRLTSSAMYASMPVYTLRYATLHLGKLYMITQTVVGRMPDEADDARMAEVLSGMRLLSSVSDPTPAPTPVPTPTPEPTPEPTPGVAEVIASEGLMEVEGVPAYTKDAELTINGKTDPGAAVTVAVGEKTLGKATAKRDGTFSIRVKLPEEGDLVLAVMTDTAEAMLATHYEMPSAKLIITEPQEKRFTGEFVMVRGETEPNATVYINGKGMSTNVKANKNGDFSVRVFIEDEDTQTYSLRAKSAGLKESRTEITLTRVFTEREGIAKFRQKMGAVEYADLFKAPEKYAGKQFMMRGRVEDFTDYDGRACALVCVDNIAVGEWKDPVWIVLPQGAQLEAGDIASFYLVGEGLTLPADGAYTKDGAAAEAPVTSAAYIVDVSKPGAK
ncbi:MAG: hypothetical protein IKK34_05340 [Clostridia bacterium]|nr:hypothetical protein [Clostridia bacterium]